jgi:YHS domain-containing protein
MKSKLLVILATLTLAFGAVSAATVADAQSKIENPKSKIPKPYPLKICLVTDNDLDSMGDEVSITYEGQVIKFCCAPCEKKFRANPARYLAKLAPKPAERK